jgi:hypothetical protein
MEWLVAVAVSVGFGVLTGWVYGGFLSLRKGRRAGRRVHLSLAGTDRSRAEELAMLARFHRRRVSP